jgi:hypothetical protein
MQLLKISYAMARKIAGISDASIPDPDGFDAVAARVMGRNLHLDPVKNVRREFLEFPSQFTELDPFLPDDYTDYLWYRGFDGLGLHRLAHEYKIMQCRTGPFQRRVILPYIVNGELVAWTGRAIAPANVRYKDLHLSDCLIPIKQTVYNHDAMINGGKWLVVCEGPIDALKIDVYGSEFGVRAVALSTNSISEEQVLLIEEWAPLFDRVLVMMDATTSLGIVDSMKLKQQVRAPNLQISVPPFGAKDAGALTAHQARAWCSEIVGDLHGL